MAGNGSEAELVPRGETALAVPNLTPVDLLRIAVTQGADIDKLAKLMDLQERWEKNEARKAYTAAMNRFKANPPTITKNKLVSFETGKGTTSYRHATLDHMCDAITAGLGAVGITHRWTVKQEKDVIWVSCVLTHELGHSEETTLMGAPDNSGGKNSIQAIASAVTYLERYTLKAACGLAEQNDNDGQTVSSKGMDATKLEDFCRQMEDVETLADLKTVYDKALIEAQTAMDRTAMATVVALKKKRKGEIENANR
jgi:hypothetical protein